MALLQYLDTNNIGNFSNGIGKGIYVLLINPAVTFIAMIYNQVGNEDYIAVLCSRYAPLERGFVIDNWIWVSLTAQIVLSVVLLLVSAWLLNPLHAVSLQGKRDREYGDE